MAGRPRSPATGSDRPAVVLIHGGGWEARYQGMFERHLTDLASSGYVGFDVTHRLSGTAPFPAAVEDIKAALAWVREHADEYGVDPDRVAIGGHSSGAHLAALVAVTPDVPGLAPDDIDPDVGLDVAGVVAMNGPFDLAKLGGMDPSRLFISGFIRRLLDGTYAERPEAYRQASVVWQLSEDLPPFLLLTSADDEEVPMYESVHVRDHLRERGGKVELDIAPHGGHGAFLANGSQCRTGIERVRAFLDEIV